MLPGKEQMPIYTCNGKIPTMYLNTESPKPILPVMIIDLLSIGLHISLSLTKWVLKHCYKSKFEEYRKFRLRLGSLVTKDTLYMFVVQIVSVIIVVTGSFYIPRKINHMHPFELQTFPNYYILYIQDLVLNPCCLILVVLLFLFANSKLRNDVMLDLKNYAHDFKARFLSSQT